MGVVVGLLILSAMMIVHELGHYLTGRKLGFTIEEFSIFMGPRLFSWERGGIRYSLKLFPIGASVRFAGEYPDPNEPVDSSRPGDFYNRPLTARAAVIATGPALNLFSGVLAFLIMFLSFGYVLPTVAGVYPDTPAAAAGLAAGDRIVSIAGKAVRTTLDYGSIEMYLPKDKPVRLGVRGADGNVRQVDLQPMYRTAYQIGVTREPGGDQPRITSVESWSNGGDPVLKAGDRLISADGKPISDPEAFSGAVAASAGRDVVIRVLRDGAEIDVPMRATERTVQIPRDLAFASGKTFGAALEQSFQWSWSIVKATVRGIGMMISGQVRAQDTLSGPVGVVAVISDVVSQTESLSDRLYQLLWLFALISVSLGFMNLLPIPPLDGNHLILIAVEAIRGKRLSPRVQSAIGMIGFGLIILLALAGLYFDVMRLTGRG